MFFVVIPTHMLSPENNSVRQYLSLSCFRFDIGLFLLSPLGSSTTCSSPLEFIHIVHICAMKLQYISFIDFIVYSLYFGSSSVVVDRIQPQKNNISRDERYNQKGCDFVLFACIFTISVWKQFHSQTVDKNCFSSRVLTKINVDRQQIFRDHFRLSYFCRSVLFISLSSVCSSQFIFSFSRKKLFFFFVSHFWVIEKQWEKRMWKYTMIDVYWTQFE